MNEIKAEMKKNINILPFFLLLAFLFPWYAVGKILELWEPVNNY